MGRNATSKIGVNAVTGRGYNPSVAPKARQLPLHGGVEKRSGTNYFCACLQLLLSHILGVSLLPSFCTFWVQKSTSLLRGRQGGSAARHRISAVVHFYQDVCARRTHIYFLPKGQKIQPAQRADITAPVGAI